MQEKIAIWVDADACPKVIREVLFRAATRVEVALTLVANHALPVQVDRNGLRGIVIGTGRYSVLQLPYLPVNADIDVGDNIGARLQADQAEADMRVARANAEGRRAMAVAAEQENVASIEENRAKVIKEALKKLPEEEYTLVLLYYFEEQSIEEISRVTKLSESNTKVKLYRARKKLYTILNELMKDELYTIL